MISVIELKLTPHIQIVQTITQGEVPPNQIVITKEGIKI